MDRNALAGIFAFGTMTLSIVQTDDLGNNRNALAGIFAFGTLASASAKLGA